MAVERRQRCWLGLAWPGLAWPVVVAATVLAVLAAAVRVLAALPVTWADLGRGQWFLFQIG